MHRFFDIATLRLRMTEGQCVVSGKQLSYKHKKSQALRTGFRFALPSRLAGSVALRSE